MVTETSSLPMPGRGFLTHQAALAGMAVLVLAVTASAQAPGQTSGQAAGPPPAATSAVAGTATSPPLKVIILKPMVRFENAGPSLRKDWGLMMPAGSGKNAPTGLEGTYQQLLLSAANTGVGSRVSPLAPDTLGAPVVDLCAKLEPLASRMARGNVNDEAIADLTSLAALDEHYAVLVSFLRLDYGPGRSWDPNTGAITSSTDSTLIQVSLVSAKTGTVIWKGERLIRNKALKPTDAALSKALTEMYRDFSTTQEARR